MAEDKEYSQMKVRLPKDVHRLFRIESTKQNVSMAALILNWIKDYIKQKGK